VTALTKCESLYIAQGGNENVYCDISSHRYKCVVVPSVLYFIIVNVTYCGGVEWTCNGEDQDPKDAWCMGRLGDYVIACGTYG
jgi:hypothetical protein